MELSKCVELLWIGFFFSENQDIWYLKMPTNFEPWLMEKQIRDISSCEKTLYELTRPEINNKVYTIKFLYIHNVIWY